MAVKVLYVSNLDPEISVGYNSKILGQAKGLAKDSICGLITFNLQKEVTISYISQINQETQNTYTFKHKFRFLILRRLYLLRVTFKIILQHKNSLKYLYFRYPRSDPFYLTFLAIIKKIYPYITIFCEFPTFPYDQEVSDKSFKSFLILTLDRLTRRYLKFFISKAIVINYCGDIFGIPSFNIQNGIVVNDFPLRQPNYDQNTIHLLGVANVQDYHGYDRIIKGMAEYYNQNLNPVIVFHIVGINSSSHSLIKLSTEFNIKQYIFTYPPMIGNDLDNLFNLADLAISTLAAHRIGLSELSPLKSREYCARGIPFILGYKDLDFPSYFSYCKVIEASDEYVSVPELIHFAKQMRQNKDHPHLMRSYAQENLDWSRKMPDLTNY